MRTPGGSARESPAAPCDMNQPAAAAGSYSIRDGYSCTCLRETAVRAYVGLQTAAPTPERNLTFLLGFEPRQSTGHREMDGSTSPVTGVRARDKLAHYYPPQHGKKRQHDRTTNLVKVRTPMHDLWPSRSLSLCLLFFLHSPEEQEEKNDTIGSFFQTAGTKRTN
jgi:hypothetical protein